MAFKECVIYKAVCDCCEAEADYEEFWGWVDKSEALSHDDRFQTVGEQHLCDECWCWPEDLPDYPGDDKWQGGDDPVRKVGCHPEPDVSGPSS